MVEDEGPGVPDELKDVLFEPFRQGDELERARRGDRAVARAAVRRAPRRRPRAIEDRDGGGARFVVDLPGEVSLPEPVHAEEDEPKLHAV